MSSSLLVTKLYFPAVRPARVKRPRLVERLETGLQGPLTLLSAPAGYGKSTLMAEWRATPGNQMPAAWVSLDAGDNNLITFLRYVAAALDTLEGGLTANTRLLLQSEQPLPATSLLTALVNDVDRYPADFVLALDDGTEGLGLLCKHIRKERIMNTRTKTLRNCNNCNHLLSHENRLKMAWCNPEKGKFAFKRLLALVIFLLVAVLVSACGVSAGDSDKAQQALVTFFEQLNRGDYEEAVKWYGGSYETLMSLNPDQSPDDLTGLWQNGCQINGLQCLPLRTVTFNEQTFKGEYIFTVEFETADGALFVLEACCGENPTTPPQFQFEYRVVKGGDGQFRVLDMPVYMP